MNKDPDSYVPEKSRLLEKTLFFLCLTVIVGLAVSIPFVYQSMTIWYKIGIARSLLQAAKVSGILALLLICLQLLAAAKFQYPVKLFGLAAVMRFHRVNGGIVFFLVFVHIFLMLAPEGVANLPIGYKYWPEMVGALLFILVAFLFFTSIFRENLGFSYSRWRALHRPLGYGCFALLFIHVRFVSDSFINSVPQAGLYCLFLAVACAIGWAKRDGLGFSR